MSVARDKVVSAADAVALIRTGDTLCVSGFVGIGTPESLIAALERRFVRAGEPRDLTLVFAAAPGDGDSRGLNRLAHEGLVRRAIGGHWSLVPKLARLAVSGRIAAWNLPLGCISHLYRAIAAHGPGHLTKVGLGTFADPLNGGGRINDATTDDLVERVELRGETWLLYRAFPVQVAFIRATTADPRGNLTMEREALTLDSLAAAMAARNSNGLVVAQVERIAEAGSLRPREVKIPGVLVDCVVEAQPGEHAQTYRTPYSAAFSGEIRARLDTVPELALDGRKVIARRSAFELPMNGVVNLGIGMPEGVAAVANEEKVLRYVTLTAEPGVIGGMPASGLDFGAAVNNDAIVDQNQQFDFYDGGGLDLACLGLAQVDAAGNVNVSRFGPRLAGAGGFINISQNARKVVFAGTFTAGGLKVAVQDGALQILSEGRTRKFLSAVEQVTFNGAYAAERAQPVLYVTERCVFRRTARGMELAEVAPGIDVERDILAHMDFEPIVDSPLAMDSRIFAEGAMGLDGLLLDLQFDDRIGYDAERNLLFLNLEGFHVRTRADVERVRKGVTRHCEAAGRKVALIVNYDSCTINPEMTDAYADMIHAMHERYYTAASRYTTSAFMRMKLGDALERRAVAPHIFETHAEARAFLTGQPPGQP